MTEKGFRFFILTVIKKYLSITLHLVETRNWKKKLDKQQSRGKVKENDNKQSSMIEKAHHEMDV